MWFWVSEEWSTVWIMEATGWKNPQLYNKKQIFFHISSKFLFHMQVWDTKYSVKLWGSHSSSCCLGVSQRESCSECSLFCQMAYYADWMAQQNRQAHLHFIIHVIYWGFPEESLRIPSPWVTDQVIVFLKYKLSFSWSIWNTVFSSSSHFRAPSPSSVNDHICSQIKSLQRSQFLPI